MCEASIRKDADGIAAVLADDYALVHMMGMRQSKRAYIEAVIDGTLNYYSADHEFVEATIAPDGLNATIRGRLRTTAPCSAAATRSRSSPPPVPTSNGQAG